MISFPAFFFALSSVALLGALAAIWNSLRTALGGGPRVAIETSRDLPDHAALNDEKSSLLRAIKDLEYEHAVGKIGAADFALLDAAYRARAKQVLVQLDRDVKPLYEEAERLIAARLAGGEAKRAKPRSKKKKDAVDAPREATAAEAPSLDTIVARIRAGEIVDPPEPPEDWPDEAKRFFVDAVRRAIDETRAQRDEATSSVEGSAASSASEHATELRGVDDAAAGPDDAPADDDAAAGDDDAAAGDDREDPR